ncbi:MAG: hypothetical protein Q9178_001767 [Gyalolechia marmorata]
MDKTHEYCESDYTIRFGCTNTTYTDSDGKAEGETIFIETQCRTNVQDNIDDQDVRYENLVKGTLISFPRELYRKPQISPTPFSDDTLTRYRDAARNELPPRKAPYEACGAFDDFQDDIKYLNCTNVLLSGFYDNQRVPLADFTYNSANPKKTSLTSQNMTLLKYYGAIACNEPEGAESYGYANFTTNQNESRSLRWHWVPDGDPEVFKNPYECFGD